MFGVFRVKNHIFTPKNHIFSNFRGGGAGCAPPPGSAPALCDQVSQLLAAGRWFSSGTPVSSTNKTDRHDITEILLKGALHTTNQPLQCESNLGQS